METDSRFRVILFVLQLCVDFVRVALETSAVSWCPILVLFSYQLIPTLKYIMYCSIAYKA